MIAWIVVAVVILTGLVIFIASRSYKASRNKLHLIGLPSALFINSSVLFLASRNMIDLNNGAIFFLVFSLGMPFMVAWGEEFTRRMAKIATTGDFELGLPSPSEDYQFLGAVGQLVQQLAKPIVAVEGSQKINNLIRERSENEPMLAHFSVNDEGRLIIDRRVLAIFSASSLVKNGLVGLVDDLIEESRGLSGSSEEEFKESLKKRTESTFMKHSRIFIKFGLMDRIAGGLFSDRVSTGFTDLDLVMEGGYPKRLAVLVCGPPSDERNLFLDSFIGTGTRRGHSCLYVTSSQPPENVKRRFGGSPANPTIVDCYTNRVEEVSTITREGNVIVSPIEMGVVSVAISRAMDKEDGKVKRAVVDILPTYLVFQSVEKIYLDLMEIIDDLRKNGYTVLFSLNPYYIKDEGAISTLEELFDGIIHVERTADESGVRNEIKLRVDKMAGQQLSRSTFSIQLPGTRGWTAERQTPGETGPYPDTTPVEA
jgi:KaiC/GvpD/RAD55 family RecA-like ATPase